MLNMLLPDIELAPALRRQMPVVWPEGLAGTGRVAGHELVVTTDLPAVLGLHPRQSDASLQGALALVSETAALLREISGFAAYSWGSATNEETLSLALQIMQKWKELRQLPWVDAVLWVHADSERELVPEYARMPRWHRLSAEGLRRDLSALVPYQGATVLLTNAAVEKLGAALGSVITTCRSLGCLCGLVQTDLLWLAAGFWPTGVGLDFAVLDLSPWSGEAGGLSALGCTIEIEPFLPQPRWRSTEMGFLLQADRVLSIGWNPGPILQLPRIAACYASLRRLGGEGLKQLSQQAAVHAQVVHKRVAATSGEGAVHSSLHEVWVPGHRQHAHFCGWESRSELEEIVSRLVEN